MEYLVATGGQLWFEVSFVFVEGGKIDINVIEDADGPVNETSFLTYTLVGETLTLTTSDGLSAWPSPGR